MRRIQLLFPGYISLQWLQEKINTRWTSSARFFLQNWAEVTEDRHKDKVSGEKLATSLKEEHLRELFFTSIKQGKTARDSKNYVNNTSKINRYHERENEMFISAERSN